MICALSGGVDSSVVALLVNKAIKKNPSGQFDRPPTDRIRSTIASSIIIFVFFDDFIFCLL